MEHETAPAPTTPDGVVVHGMIERSPAIGKLAMALAKAQLAMKPAAKDSKNPHFGNKYADLASVLEAAKPLSENGLAVMQLPIEAVVGRAALTTILAHESGEWIASTCSCKLQKDDAQGFGSAVTYLRRYSLQAIVGIAADDDDGNAASGNGNGSGNARVNGSNQRANGNASGATSRQSDRPAPAAKPAEQPRIVSGKVERVTRSPDGAAFAIEIDGTKYPTANIEHAQKAKAAKESGGSIALTLDAKGTITASALADENAQAAA